MSSDRRAAPGYFRALGAVTVGLLAALALFNFAMDPYDVWGHWGPGVGRYKPWLHSNGPQQLAAVVRRPTGLIVGSSRVAVGFDPDGAEVRALGPPLIESVEFSKTVGFTYQEEILGAAVRGGRLRNALMELDLREFSPCQHEEPAPGDAEVLPRVLLMPAFPASWRVLKASLRADLDRAPQLPIRLASGLAIPPKQSAEGIAAAAPRLAAKAFQPASDQCDSAYSGRPLARLDALRALAAGSHVRLVFFLSPLHPRVLRSMYVGGEWPRFEALRRGLAGYAAGAGVPVWDFSTAALRDQHPVTDADFYDATHFRPAVGERMLQAMRLGDANLGRPLSPKGLEAELAAERAAIGRLIAPRP